MKRPFVSIIIPVRNEEKNLPRLFKSLSLLDYPKNKLEIIIVDGCSSDQTVALAKKYRAKIISNPEIIRGAGCQIGIEVAKGKLVAFTDADCTVPSHWLKGLIKFFHKDDLVAGVGGPNLTPKDDSRFAQAVGDVLTLLTKAGSRYGLQSQETREIYHNPGCNVVYRKKAILQAGGFNCDLITCEDEELDYRLREKGFKLLFVPNISVNHYRRFNYRGIFNQSFRFALGRAQAIKIHHSMAQWFHFIPSILIISFFLSVLLVFLSNPLAQAAKIYLGLMFFLFLLLAFYLSLIYQHTFALTYFLILNCWFWSWGFGLIAGLFKQTKLNQLNANEKVEKSWQIYWQKYQGVTKMGAWSQKQSLKIALDLLKQENVKKDSTVIDVGAGEGRTLLALRKMGFKNNVGIDFSQKSLEICQKNGLIINQDVFLQNAFKTKYKNKEFDLIFSEGLLEHFQDPIPLIKEMARISDKYILLIQPNHFSLYGLAIALLGNIIRGNIKEYSFSKTFFTNSFQNNGFNLKSQKYTVLGEFFVLLFKRQ